MQTDQHNSDAQAINKHGFEWMDILGIQIVARIFQKGKNI
jgi:hypothetical protein